MKKDERRDISMVYEVGQHRRPKVIQHPLIHPIVDMRVDNFLEHENFVDQVLRMGLKEFKGHLRYFIRNIRKMDWVFLAVGKTGKVLASTFVVAQYQEWIIAEVMTHGRWKRRGLNKALQTGIIDAAHKSCQSPDPIYLLTLTCNPVGAAYNLYAGLGYQRVGTQK